MPRNKHPEETIKKILDVSYHLFMEKGYQQTSIQDIVTKMGMSKGAIYHHFKTKEDILDRICNSYYSNSDWFNNILNSESISGLDKLKKLFYFELEDEKKRSLDLVTLPLMKNADVLIRQLNNSIIDIAPMIAGIIVEGNKDGSLKVEDPLSAAEVLLLLINFWINPGVFTITLERYQQKVLFYINILESVGIPLRDNRIIKASTDYFNAVAGSDTNSASMIQK